MTEQASSHSRKVALIVGLALVVGLALAAGAGTLLYLNRDKLPFLAKQEKPAEAPPNEPATPPASAPSDPSLSSRPSVAPTPSPVLSTPPPPSPALSTPTSRSAGPIPVQRLDSLAAAVADARRPGAASSPIQADERTYRSYTARNDVLVLVDYYADWCAPCRNIAPALTQLAAKHGDKVVILKVNVDRERSLANAAGVRPIPDVRLLHKGKELERSLGGRPYEHYEGLVLKHASALPAASRPAAPAPAARPAAAPAPASRPAPNTPDQPRGTITPLKKDEDKDWLPPGVSPLRS